MKRLPAWRGALTRFTCLARGPAPTHVRDALERAAEWLRRRADAPALRARGA